MACAVKPIAMEILGLPFCGASAILDSIHVYAEILGGMGQIDGDDRTFWLKRAQLSSAQCHISLRTLQATSMPASGVESKT